MQRPWGLAPILYQPLYRGLVGYASRTCLGGAILLKRLEYADFVMCTAASLLR